jgi:predicted outer membrane repeat protein
MFQISRLFLSVTIGFTLTTLSWLVMQAVEAASVVTEHTDVSESGPSENPLGFDARSLAACLNNITVASTTDSGPETLRQALADICSSGTIEFAAGLASQTIVLTSTELSITKTVTITNPNAPDLKVSGNNAHRVFNVQAGAVVTISNLSIISGTVSSGAPILGAGGGILVNSGATLNVYDSAFTGNSASRGGGVCNHGMLTVNSSTFTGNSASPYGGGGIYNYLGTLKVKESIFSGNSATSSDSHGGGGIYSDFGTATIDSSIFSANSAPGFSGGGAIYNVRSTLIVNNSVFNSNSARDGGGIWNRVGSTTVVNGSTFNGNSATIYGGSIDTEESLTLTNSIFSGNSACLGGGLYNSGSMVITNSTLSGNSATCDGGGIASQGIFALNNSIISGNSAIEGGGGIQNTGRLTLNNSTLSGNSASDGGGLYSFISSSVMDLNNATITDNSATDFGGGISHSPGGTLNLKNTILAGNLGPTAFRDCYGTLNSQGYNLIQDTAGCTIVGDTTGNLVGVAPNLSPLADNGGTTPTHALDSDSPAIDAGSCSGVTVDQRGFMRPVDIPTIPNVDDGCDIGAYEYGSSASPPMTSVYLPIVLK